MSDGFLLLVEDNPDDEALIRRALQKNSFNHEVVVVRDGEEALHYLFATGAFSGRSAEQPKFILLDLKLPKLNGLEVLRRVRDDSRTKLVPVIIFTSSNEEKEIIASYRIGANSYVRKSVDFAKFNDALRQLCTYWFDVNENAAPTALQAGE